MCMKVGSGGMINPLSVALGIPGVGSQRTLKAPPVAHVKTAREVSDEKKAAAASRAKAHVQSRKKTIRHTQRRAASSNLRGVGTTTSTS
jgi:hypothetical protein